MSPDVRILAYMQAVIRDYLSDSDGDECYALWRTLTEEEQSVINRFSVVCSKRIDPDGPDITDAA